MSWIHSSADVYFGAGKGKMNQTAKVNSSVVDAAELMARAASIRPVLEKNADDTDRLRRLPDANVQALRETGLCRLMVPRRMSGYETDIHTYIAVMAELGRGWGLTAWTAPPLYGLDM